MGVSWVCAVSALVLQFSSELMQHISAESCLVQKCSKTGQSTSAEQRMDYNGNTVHYNSAVQSVVQQCCEIVQLGVQYRSLVVQCSAVQCRVQYSSAVKQCNWECSTGVQYCRTVKQCRSECSTGVQQCSVVQYSAQCSGTAANTWLVSSLHTHCAPLHRPNISPYSSHPTTLHYTTLGYTTVYHSVATPPHCITQHQATLPYSR